MQDVFAVSPSALLRLVVIGAITYVTLVMVLRVFGKRTLAKLNAFDLVVTVALGSTLSSAILSQDVPVVQGITAILLLVAAQFVVAWSSVRVGWVRRVTRSEPTMLFEDGRFHYDRMRRERVTESDLRQAMRASGYGRLEKVQAVVLETDGSFSVLGHTGDLTHLQQEQDDRREPSQSVRHI